MPPKLEQVFTFRLFQNTLNTLPLGSTKGGAQRMICPFSSGFLKGSAISADMVLGGADSFTLDTAKGVGYTNVQAHFRAADAPETGEPSGTFFMTYQGVVKLDEKLQLALSGSPEARTTSSEERYCLANVVFEVSEERHKWMEQMLFVGQGHAFVGEGGSAAAE